MSSLHTKQKHKSKLLVAYLLNTYKQKLESTIRKDLSDTLVASVENRYQHQLDEAHDRVRMLKKELQKKIFQLTALKQEKALSEKLAYRNKFEKVLEKNQIERLKKENEVLIQARNEQTTLVSRALNKYENEQMRFKKTIGKVTSQIIIHQETISDTLRRMQALKLEKGKLESQLNDATKSIAYLQHLTHNRRRRLQYLKKERVILLEARKNEAAAFEKCLVSHREERSLLKKVLEQSKERIRFLQNTISLKNNVIKEMKEEMQAVLAARDQEKRLIEAMVTDYNTERECFRQKLRHIRHLVHMQATELDDHLSM